MSATVCSDPFPVPDIFFCLPFLNFFFFYKVTAVHLFRGPIVSDRCEDPRTPRPTLLVHRLTFGSAVDTLRQPRSCARKGEEGRPVRVRLCRAPVAFVGGTTPTAETFGNEEEKPRERPTHLSSHAAKFRVPFVVLLVNSVAAVPAARCFKAQRFPAPGVRPAGDTCGGISY